MLQTLGLGRIENFIELWRAICFMICSSKRNTNRKVNTMNTVKHIATINVYGVRTSIYAGDTSDVVVVYRWKNGYSQAAKVEPASKWAKYIGK